MRHQIRIGSLLVTTLTAAVLMVVKPAWSQPAGTLDPTFGSGGLQLTEFGPGGGAALIGDLALQPDGKIVTAGSGAPTGEVDFAVVRQNSDGSLDPTFSGDGIVLTDVAPPFDWGFAMALHGDGKIVVTGDSVVQYNPDGTLDTGFDGDGILTAPARSHAVLAQSDGKVVIGYGVAGDFAMARYNTDGTLDGGFDGDGIAVTDMGGVNEEVGDLALQSDGKILAVAGGVVVQPGFLLARYNTDGSLDTSFDGDGKVLTLVGADAGSNAIGVQSDGKIVVVGTNAIGLVAVRYNTNGSLDTSFDGDGILQTPVVDDAALVGGGKDVTFQGDGKIVIAADCGEPYECVVRLNPDGSFDPRFGSGGRVLVDGYKIDRVAWQSSDKKIVTFGASEDDPQYPDTQSSFAVARFIASCGDGALDGAFEQCDDGNITNGDGCDNNCTFTACGNDIVSPDEDCEDGNVTEGDGCDSDCTFTACGNGIRTSGEACDDGNAVPGDGCESDCSYSPVIETTIAGGTVTTDPGALGATADRPVQSSITTPNAGEVAIVVQPESGEIEGFAVVGAELQIEAPPATAGDPLVIVLTVDSSAIPADVDPTRLDVTRNGVALADCTGAPGVAEPDPCMESRVVLPGGDVEITVLTSAASLWAMAVSALTKDEQKCLNGVSAAGVKVAGAQTKLTANCLKAAAKGDDPNAQACLLADAAGKVGAAMQKTIDLVSDKCAVPPPFGPTAPATVNAAARQAQVDFAADVFGVDLTTVVLTDEVGAKCQAAGFKAMNKLFNTIAKLFLKCKKDGLKGKTALVISEPQLAGCFDVLAADSKGKIAKTAGKIDAVLKAKCAAVGFSEAFPGACDGEVGGVCIGKRVGCRICEHFNATEGLSEDCDAFDDGVINSSCN